MRKPPPVRLVHLWLADGTISCKGLTIADVARPLPEALQITPYEAEVTCPTCKAKQGRASA